MTAYPTISHGIHKSYDYLDRGQPKMPVFIEQLNRHYIDAISFFTWTEDDWKKHIKDDSEGRVAYFRVYPKTN